MSRSRQLTEAARREQGPDRRIAGGKLPGGAGAGAHACAVEGFRLGWWVMNEDRR